MSCLRNFLSDLLVCFCLFVSPLQKMLSRNRHCSFLKLLVFTFSSLSLCLLCLKTGIGFRVYIILHLGLSRWGNHNKQCCAKRAYVKRHSMCGKHTGLKKQWFKGLHYFASRAFKVRQSQQTVLCEESLCEATFDVWKTHRAEEAVVQGRSIWKIAWSPPKQYLLFHQHISHVRKTRWQIQGAGRCEWA